MRRALVVVAVLAVGGSLGVTASADDKGRCISASEQGQQQRDAGKYSAARESFTQCARDACPALIRRDCTRWLSDLGQLQPSVVFGAKDPAGNDLSAVTVLADGAPLVASLDGKPVSIDPGEHTFRFEAQGLHPIERPFVVRAGEKSRLVVAQFGDPTPAPPVTPEKDAMPASTGASIPTGTWVFGGLAVVAFAGEAYFGLTGLSDRSSLESQPCAKNATCNSSDVTSIRTKFTVADIALGVGLTSAALAAYLYLTRGSTKAPETHASHLDIAPVTGGAAATWRLRF